MATDHSVTDHSVIVIGAGLAGSTAALRAAELGRDVVLLEQGETSDFACNTRYSGGIFHVAYHDMKQPPEVLYAAIRATAGDAAADEQVAMISTHAGRAIDWLGGHGTSFTSASDVSWHRWTVAPPRPLLPGFVFPGRGFDPVLRRMQETLVQFGGRFAPGYRVTSVTRRPEGGFAVTAMTRAGEVRFAAADLVLADGGFAGSPAMVGRHIAPRPDLIVPRGAATGRGDGMSIAASLGAACSDINCFYGHLLSRDALHEARLSPYPQLDAVASAGIVVDATGHRFGDESRGGVYFANLLARRPDPTDAIAIFDATVWEDVGRASLYPPNPHVASGGGKVWQAPTITALARLAGLPPDALQTTVQAFNAGAAPEAPRRRAGGPIVSPPFFAIPLAVGLTHTMGGPLIDGCARVLDHQRRPIPGLYAAGTTTGGLEGGESAAYVGGLVKALVMGLVAAEHIAAPSNR